MANYSAQQIVKQVTLDLTRKFSYTKDGETKEGSCSTYLNLIASKALVDQRVVPLAYQLAKKLQDNQVVEIIHVFFLISKIFYTFLHRAAASDREKYGRLSARGPYRSRRHRSLENRQRSAGWMRTHSSWSRSARIWESGRRSWTPVYRKLRSSFQRTSCKRRSRDHAKLRHAQRKRELNQRRRPSNRSSDE